MMLMRIPSLYFIAFFDYDCSCSASLAPNIGGLSDLLNVNMMG